MNTPLHDRPIFICGHPKSGTSLLRNILDSHPELVVYPEETGFFRRYLPAATGRNFDRKIALAEEQLIHIFEWQQENPPLHQKGFPDRDYSHISYEALLESFHKRVEAGPLRHDGDILSSAVLAYGEVTGHLGEQTKHWVEKSPYNERYARQIFKWWPEALCIHIVRDPRDNCLSYQRKHPEWKAETFATSWNASTQEGLTNQETFGEGHYRIIRYEELVTKPGPVLAEICDFLGIQANERLATPSRAGQEWAGNSMFGIRFQEIDSSAVGRWQAGLPASDAGFLWRAGKPLMLALGYDLNMPIPLTTYFREAKWRLHSAVRGTQADTS